MAFRLWPTNIRDEGFVDSRDFIGGLSFFDVMSSKYPNIRSPTQAEYNKIYHTLSDGLVRGGFGDSDFQRGNYTVQVYVFEGQLTSSKLSAAAHNSSANAIAAGAPTNSIWIGYDAAQLSGGATFKQLSAYGSHEIQHSSDKVNVRAKELLNDFSEAEVKEIAIRLGYSESDTKAVLLRAIEHKLIGEKSEAVFPGVIVETSSATYILSSLYGLETTSLSKGDFDREAAAVARYLDSRIAESCFAAHTLILTFHNTSTAISALRVGDIVLSYDPRADHGRGALTPRRVKRLFRNATMEWIVLRWVEDGQVRELTLTPGHHVLDQYGQFPTIEAMLRDGVATVVLASGELAQVTAERIVYSAATAHLYERAQSLGMMAGNAALQPVEMDAWQTYNFEVEDLHSYVAGSVRVHNWSTRPMGWSHENVKTIVAEPSFPLRGGLATCVEISF